MIFPLLGGWLAAWYDPAIVVDPNAPRVLTPAPAAAARTLTPGTPGAGKRLTPRE